ncbi:MAG TPA: GAF and ANTAR domain-containing protein [Euzebyales bacterium]
MGTRALALAAALIDLADTLVSDFELTDYLDRLLERSLGLLDADAGSVMLCTGDEAMEPQLLASYSRQLGDHELFEVRHEGPGVDSLVGARQVIVDDIAASTRWPRFAAIAATAGYASVVALPMRLRGETIGTVSVFWRESAPAALDDIDAVQALADMATIGILQERELHEARELSSQLQTALHTRIVIEQAKGVLAEQMGLQMSAAFEVLRRYSRNHSHCLRQVATDVVAGRLSAPDIIAMTGDDGAAAADDRVPRPSNGAVDRVP